MKAIIFDCFGVIIADALQVLTASLRSANPELAKEAHDIIGLMNRGIGNPEESRRQLAEILGMDAASYRSKIAQGEVKDQQLLDYILELRKTYRVGVLSNIPKDSLGRRFTDEEMKTYFDSVVASGEIGYAKPEARAYEYVAEQLKVRAEECVFTDDREEYVEGARAVGMQAIWYQDFFQFKHDLEQILTT